VSMLPGMIDMIMGIILDAVPHPLIVDGVDMRRFRVARLVVELWMVVARVRRWNRMDSVPRTVRGDVSSANFGMAGAALRMTALGMATTLWLRMAASLGLTTV
jgi:hypothetical protein